MSNDLTGLIPDIYEALDVVSREQVGFAVAVNANNRADRAAKGQTVRVPVYGEEQVTDISPGVTSPDDGDNATTHVDVILTHAKRVPVRLTGTDTVGLNQGVGASNYKANRFAQGFRKLANLLEASLAAQIIQASRAVGTAGTTPFASGIADAALARQILVDNGAPLNDLRMVVNSSSGVNLRSLSILTKANEAGTDATLRTGAILNVHGFSIGESGAVDALSHTKGSGSGYLVNSSALVIGSTSIPVDTGTGTILAGDVVTFAGDTNKYVVTTALAGGSFTIAAPGLRKVPADNAAVTLGNSYVGNLAFSRSAFHLASRVPELPTEGDSAVDRTVVTDPFSGLSFEISMYPQYRQMQYEIALVWGSKIIKPEHTCLILG